MNWYSSVCSHLRLLGYKKRFKHWCSYSVLSISSTAAVSALILATPWAKRAADSSPIWLSTSEPLALKNKVVGSTKLSMAFDRALFKSTKECSKLNSCSYKND